MKLINERINEKFVRSDNKLGNLGVGKLILIKEWLTLMEIENYTINDDLTIDIKISNPILYKKKITQLPEYIQFGTVDAYFPIGSNYLISLRGCPHTVTQNFIADNNNLENLKGGPKFVGGDYWCSRNPLNSLEGAPEHISGSFWYTPNPAIASHITKLVLSGVVKGKCYANWEGVG